jgi:hypothetical protein
MQSSGMLRRVALLRTDVSEDFFRSVLRLQVTANVVPSSPILVILMIQVIRFFERSVFTKATRRNIPYIFIDLINQLIKLIYYTLRDECWDPSWPLSVLLQSCQEVVWMW